jgi:hypothetical protein
MTDIITLISYDKHSYFIYIYTYIYTRSDLTWFDSEIARVFQKQSTEEVVVMVRADDT